MEQTTSQFARLIGDTGDNAHGVRCVRDASGIEFSWLNFLEGDFVSSLISGR